MQSLCPISMANEKASACNPACKLYDAEKKECMLRELVEKKLRKD